MMPVAGAAGGVPPGGPPFDTGYVDPYGDPYGDEPDTPWYKQPGFVVGVVLLLLAIGGVIAYLLLNDDDEEAPVASPESSLLVLEVTDETGASLDTGFIVGVNGPPESQFDYTWVQPAAAVAGELAGDGTGSDGRVEFEWQPAGVDSDPTTWPATVTFVQQLPAGWTAPGPIIECVLARPDTQDITVLVAAAVEAQDPAAEQLVTYTFPNYQFLAGDTVTCRLSSIRPVETTTTSTTPPTTIEDITTTVEETTTTVAPAPTTVPVVTVPPQAEATLWDVIDNSPDLSELKALIERAGLQDVFSDPNATLTLLAPSNQAITTAAAGVGAPDFDNPAIVESVLLTHVDTTQALLITQLLGLDPPEFVVANPGPHAIDAGANPPTIGGATVLVADIEAANGVLHVIDRVLIPEELPE